MGNRVSPPIDNFHLFPQPLKDIIFQYTFTLTITDLVYFIKPPIYEWMYSYLIRMKNDKPYIKTFTYHIDICEICRHADRNFRLINILNNIVPLKVLRKIVRDCDIDDTKFFLLQYVPMLSKTKEGKKLMRNFLEKGNVS